MSDALLHFFNFIHEAQKERGSVAFYLRSRGLEFADELEAQFAVVDNCIKPFAALPKSRSAKLEPFLNAAFYLPSKRKYLIARMIDPAEALVFYSREIIAPAIEIVQEIAVFDPENQPSKVSAFAHFLHWKERVALERALGTQLVEHNLLDSAEFREKLTFIISEQQAYERMFLTLADENGKAELERIKKSNDAFKKIDAIHHALTNGRVPSEPLSAAQWFGLFTTKLDLLHELGKSMIVHIRETGKPDLRPAKQAAPAEESKPAIETGVRAYMDRIAPLPLFAGLDEATVQDILKYARITNHAKGAMIFMQGEQPSRFYIILEGWVKLFKGNIEGEESILQVLGVGDNLLETVIFSDAVMPVNAQAVDSVKLLSIPASILREKLRQNNTLAVNMLSTVSGRSQALISQFEQLTLKSVTQRVGWFLLKLFLESGDRTHNLKLPYDKSLIAGYLGMKPETFSRTLQALKERGIDIEKNTVNLPDVFALCDFCDPEVAERCTRHHTPECPNPQCMD